MQMQLFYLRYNITFTCYSENLVEIHPNSIVLNLGRYINFAWFVAYYACREAYLLQIAV